MTKTEKFVDLCKIKHNNTYDYSKVSYINNQTKVTIICKIHGEFQQTPHAHKRGNGCKKCTVGRESLTKKDFINKSNIKHNYKYDYSNVEYINNRTKVKIFCKSHGFFKQNPGQHLLGQGCRKCNQKKLKIFDIIEKFEKKHKQKYIYCITNDVIVSDTIKIKCPIHGIFEQKICNHFVSGCQKCAGKIKNITDFIKRANMIHCGKYNYSDVDYKDHKQKVKIECKKHGFFYQKPYLHFSGQGCPSCCESLGEKLVLNYLKSREIDFISQHKFEDCKHIKSLRFDFYLTDFNICIEYNGKQHYEVVERFGGVKEFEKVKVRDEIKKEYCRRNNIKLIILKFDENSIDILNKELNFHITT